MRAMLNGKVVSCLVVLVALARGGDHPDGSSQVSRAQDAEGNYHFSYKVQNAEGEQFREEGTDPQGRVVGSYGLAHADGTHRVVEYVADDQGFRAKVHSNEPGVAKAPPSPLVVSATAPHRFGKRLIPLEKGIADAEVKASRPDDRNDGIHQFFKVPGPISGGEFGDPSAVVPEETHQVNMKPNIQTSDESRPTDFDDYRPLSPVAYYPGRPARRPVDVPRSPRLIPKGPDDEYFKSPPDVYFPPIDPHRAVMRRPGFPKDDAKDNFFPTTTSRRPFIPPYGGFDDDDDHHRPGITMMTTLGGHRFPPPTPPTSLRGSRFPSPDNRDFGGLPRFPLGTGVPALGRVPGANIGAPNFPSNPQSGPYRPPAIGPEYGPGYAPGQPYLPRPDAAPQFVLRAVPIPNGIQAVRVDPSSGRVYERLVYPLFLRQDGRPDFDRNVLLHNEAEDDFASDVDPNYEEPPHSSARVYRGPRDRPYEEDSANRNRTHDRRLSDPSSEDLEWIQRRLESLNGDRERRNGVAEDVPDEDPQFARRSGRLVQEESQKLETKVENKSQVESEEPRVEKE